MEVEGGGELVMGEEPARQCLPPITLPAPYHTSRLLSHFQPPITLPAAYHTSCLLSHFPPPTPRPSLNPKARNRNLPLPPPPSHTQTQP